LHRFTSNLAGATPLTGFENFFRGFYTPNYPTLTLQISCDLHHRLRSYCRETAHPSIRPNFSVHPVGKTMRWIKKMDDTFFDGLGELYQSPCKVWGRSHNVRRLYVRKCDVCFFVTLRVRSTMHSRGA